MRRFKNILFVVEPDSDCTAAFARAVELAKENQADLTVMDVVEHIPDERWMAVTALTPKEIVDSIAEERRESLNRMIHSDSDGVNVDVRIESGRVFLEAIKAVLADGFDLVVKAVAPTPAGVTFFASIDMHLLRKCPCPVWIVGEEDNEKYRVILAAVDLHPEDDSSDKLNRQILEMAASLALAEFAELHIVHVWSLVHEEFLRSARLGFSEVDIEAMATEERTVRESRLQRLLDDIDGVSNTDAVDFLVPTLHIEKGNPKTVVPDVARKLGAELVVMGTLGRSGIPGFFIGNTAEDILESIDCSVLAIKPPGFTSPVSASR